MVDDGIYSISLSGTRQSPINIETAASVLETDETLEELQHEYQVSWSAKKPKSLFGDAPLLKMFLLMY